MTFSRFVVPTLAICMGTAGLISARASHATEGVASRSFGQERAGWDAPPQEYQEIQRQGFHDGIEGARKDVENHRRPDVNNRDEYRHPHVSGRDRKAYREGFRRGYETAISHLMNDHDRH